MKKVIFVFLFVAVLSTQAFAFLPEVTQVTKEEMKKYSDEELVRRYIDTVIERKAREAFHAKAGFGPKEYESFKDLLMLMVRLRQEIETRKLEVPPINDWLK